MEALLTDRITGQCDGGGEAPGGAVRRALPLLLESLRHHQSTGGCRRASRRGTHHRSGNDEDGYGHLEARDREKDGRITMEMAKVGKFLERDHCSSAFDKPDIFGPYEVGARVPTCRVPPRRQSVWPPHRHTSPRVSQGPKAPRLTSRKRYVLWPPLSPVRFYG